MKKTITSLMSRIFSFAILWSLILISAKAEPFEVRSRLLDAQTREAVAFAQVYITPERTALGNEDGQFCILAEPTDTLRISCIGYEIIRIVAAQAADVILLSPLTTQMSEVTVRTSGSILDKAAKRMKSMYKKDKKEESQFFCRTSQMFKGNHELMEAFIEAKSAVFLRDLAILSGRRMKLDDYTDTKPTQSQVNLHHMLEMGPMMKDALFWTDIDAPLDGKNYKRFYDATHEQYTDSSGHTTYVIHLKRKRLLGDRRVFEGTLYVDAETFDILRYTGHTPTMQIFVRSRDMMDAIYVRGNFSVDYRYDNGFAEIQAIQYKIEGEEFLGKSVLFNVDNMVGWPNKEDKKKMGENMVRAIDDAGFDSTLWANSGIVQRTMEEERIAFGHSTSINVKKLMRPAPDTTAVAATSLTQLRDRLYTFGNKNRLENALEMNAPLMKGYYLKEALREIWMQVDKGQAEQVFCDWVKQAKDSKVPLIVKFANTLMAHRSGILAWYDYHISTAKLEGINNKIKTMKRQAYGYRDEKFFELKILAMHEKNYAFVG